MFRVLSLLLTAACLALAGCGTANVNPATARSNTGYVDFYTDSTLDLSWEVKRAGQAESEMRTVFSEFDPVPGTVLRLAAPPGKYRFQVWFMNLATEGPQIAQVQVEDGKVTPVHVLLDSAGTATTERKVYRWSGSAKGFGRGTKIVADQSTLYRINTTAEAPRAYQTKEQMPYYSPEPIEK
jgi:hypothetical protein